MKIHAFIGDAPARCKACNSIQFNGKYGCLKCMHPTVWGTNKTVYPNMNNIELRTNELYNSQAITSQIKNKTYKGIKGFSYLSNWLNIPGSVLTDIMHAGYIGIFKAYFNSLFKSSNHTEAFSLSMCTIYNKYPLTFKSRDNEWDFLAKYKRKFFLFN